MSAHPSHRFGLGSMLCERCRIHQSVSAAELPCQIDEAQAEAKPAAEIDWFALNKSLST